MALTLNQILDALKQRGVSTDVLQSITEMSVTAAAASFDGTADPAQVKTYYENINKLLDENRSSLEGVIDVDEESLNTLQEEMDILREIIDNEIESGNLQSDRLQKAKRRFREVSNLAKEKQKFLEGAAKGEAAAEQLLQATFGLSTEWSALGSKEGMKGLGKGFAGGLKKMLHPMNILIAIAQKVLERAMAYDKASADLFKKTAIDRDKVRLTTMATDLKGMTVDLEQKVASSVSSLQEGFRQISDLSQSQFETTAKTITVLDGFGVSSNDTVDTFGILTQTLGQTPEQASEFLNNTVAISRELGRPPRELVNDFVKNAPIFARFGNRSMKIFKDLSLQATLLEMDTAKLFGLAEGMDTFEGAARAAQAFNIAVSGPFLSAQALLAAEGSEKFDLIAEAYKRAGRPELNQRVVRGLSKDLGMVPDELMRMLKNEGANFKTKREKMDDAQSTMAENIELQSKNQSVMDQLTAKMQQIIDSLVKATGADKGLTYVAEVLTGVAQVLAPDEMQRTMANQKKIKEEGGLIRINDEMFTDYLGDSGLGGTVNEVYYSKKQIRDARKKIKAGQGDDVKEELRDFIESSVVIQDEAGVNQLTRPSEMTDKQFEQYLKTFGGVDYTKEGYNVLSAEQTIGAIVPGELGTGYLVQKNNDAIVGPASSARGYIQPVFNKQDKFYAAKDGGAIANALDEVLTAVDKLIEQKQDVNLDISDRKLAQAVDGAFAALSARRV